MPYRRGRAKKLGADIPLAFFKYFTTGTYEVSDEGAADVFLLQTTPKMKAAWDAMKEKVMAVWNRDHPGALPWAAVHLDHENINSEPARDVQAEEKTRPRDAAGSLKGR